LPPFAESSTRASPKPATAGAPTRLTRARFARWCLDDPPAVLETSGAYVRVSGDSSGGFVPITQLIPAAPGGEPATPSLILDSESIAP